MDNEQLPAEVEAEIEVYADQITRPLKMDNDYQIGYNNGMEAGAISAGSHFAKKLHQEQLKNAALEVMLDTGEQNYERLKKWKSDATALLNPILDYGQSKEAGIPLGKSITETVLERCKSFNTARTLLEKFISRHEAGLLPDMFIYNEVKTFLDGTK